MWTVPLPQLDPRQTFETCIGGMRDAELQQRFQAATLLITQASVDYEVAANSNLLYTIPSGNEVGLVSAKEMSALYDDRMVPMSSPGRAAYDLLLSAPKYGTCPLCGVRTVSTLDHHLPKAHYPAYAVNPMNLVAACQDCNKAKSNKIPTTASEETLHPYFDNIDNERWLMAEVLNTAPAALRFFVQGPTTWSATLASRVQNQFDMLHHGKYYPLYAASELASIRSGLLKLLIAGGQAAVKDQMTERAESCKADRLNSWRTAMYEALAASDWFCGGGFQATG
jgi:hypothetical protein